MIAALVPCVTFVVPSFLCTEAVSQKKKDQAITSAGAGVAVEAADSEEVEIVYVREPTSEQAERARELKLPLTFFCYENEPGYVSDDDEDGMLHFRVYYIIYLKDKLCIFPISHLFRR